MEWFFLVSQTKQNEDLVVHSKHRTQNAAEKRIPIKQRRFQSAGLERTLKIVKSETWIVPTSFFLYEVNKADSIR